MTGYAACRCVTSSKAVQRVGSITQNFRGRLAHSCVTPYYRLYEHRQCQNVYNRMYSNAYQNEIKAITLGWRYSFLQQDTSLISNASKVMQAEKIMCNIFGDVIELFYERYFAWFKLVACSCKLPNCFIMDYYTTVALNII